MNEAVPRENRELPVMQPAGPYMSPAGELPGSPETEPAPDESGNAPEDVIILEAGKEQAQKFTRAISHPVASDVLQLLKESGPMRLSDIAEKLGRELNATKYPVGLLMDAGLLEISNTRYSIKGRKVNMYRMKNQIFIVAPSMTDRKQIMKSVVRYGAFLGLYICVALVFLLVLPVTAISGPVSFAGALFPGVVVTEPVVLSGLLGNYLLSLLLAAVVTVAVLIIYSVLAGRNRPDDPSGN